jgi:hypothetical protein
MRKITVAYGRSGLPTLAVIAAASCPEGVAENPMQVS